MAIRFSASAQLISSDLLSCHSDGGAEEVAQEIVVEEIRHDKQRKRS